MMQTQDSIQLSSQNNPHSQPHSDEINTADLESRKCSNKKEQHTNMWKWETNQQQIIKKMDSRRSEVNEGYLYS